MVGGWGVDEVTKTARPAGALLSRGGYPWEEGGGKTVQGFNFMLCTFR